MASVKSYNVCDITSFIIQGYSHLGALQRLRKPHCLCNWFTGAQKHSICFCCAVIVAVKSHDLMATIKWSTGSEALKLLFLQALRKHLGTCGCNKQHHVLTFGRTLMHYGQKCCTCELVPLTITGSGCVVHFLQALKCEWASSIGSIWLTDLDTAKIVALGSRQSSTYWYHLTVFESLQKLVK